ncbi:conserved hypothetical protein [Streptomyces sviceus ATCC 29083]|uniref:Uncharacterized protein n=1 Tax=Streptomyces sviceus (strain ATCC 29083 / DSM 924 / JCM 4929 / NBRC 13980 / NCIMB 11184 / NRRL 5439 / UC 5370) TaxID=463191 RepID=B5HM73_STRX2|nr:conserved hypothetical protein [Streptomyces sviceus ATCC 29083]
MRGPSLTSTPTGPEESGRNVSGWETSGSRRPVDAEFPLFSPPADWHVLPVGEQRLLPGHTYRLAFGKDEYNYKAGAAAQPPASTIPATPAARP